ncbi:hypothetical protein ElyMa_001011400 [Elysia marginata]|uniref:Uncharacterized protein n=1 Tax=Elysia marginata TaxID=1093978 RepID=A0AAV4HKC5_9GAST|nr:hypothetical protein ElyMa_001011400 [Elysia marginata]
MTNSIITENRSRNTVRKTWLKFLREHLKPVTMFAPWEDPANFTLNNSLEMEKSDEEIKEKAEPAQKETPSAAIELWTDGSVKDAT